MASLWHSLLQQVGKRSSPIQGANPFKDDNTPQNVRLVEDLVDQIMELGTWSRRDLTTLALVSPRWLFPIRQRLYTAVRLTSIKQWSLLTTSLAYNTRLPPLIRHLTIDQSQNVDTEQRSPQDISKSIQKLFHHLTHVQCLSFIGSIGVAYLNDGISALPAPMRLHEIEVVGSSGSTPQMPRMADKLVVWTDRSPVAYLKSLRLTRVQLQLALPPHCRGLPPYLKSLYLEDAGISNLNSLVLYPKLESLTIIDHGHNTDGYPLSHPQHILPWIANSIRYLSISLDVPELLIHQASTWQFPHCPQLHTIRTDGVYYTLENLSSIDHSCPHLEQWNVYGRNLQHFFSVWGQWVERGGMRNLQQMEVSQGETESFKVTPWPKSTEDRLKELAANRDINISFGLPDRGFSVA